MAALRAGNGNAGQDDKPAPRRSRNAGAVCDDAEASRRGVEESGPENALMREVSEVAEKDPGADPRRLSNRVCFVKFLWAVSAFLLVRLSGCF